MSPEASDMDPAGFTLEWGVILAAWWFQPMLNNMSSSIMEIIVADVPNPHLYMWHT